MLAACAVVMLSLLSFAAYAQNRASGTVVDAQGNAVPGASVVVKGTMTGTMTDAQGYFAIQAPTGATLDITCLGYASQSVPAGPNLRIVLAEDNEFLDEVVVVGYGTQKKVNLTGAVSTVDVGRTLEARPVADLGKALQGAVPGLTVMNNNGGIGGTPTLQIRGLGTLSNSQNSSPLILVDGVAMEDISYLNTQDIESISVLKDAASSSIYGTRAAFGVILITTKGAHKTDKVTVTYSNNFAFRKPTVLPEYPNTVEQMTAFKLAKDRIGATPELFGMVINDNYIEQARQWQERHGWQKAGYREMVAGDDYIVATTDTVDPVSGTKLQSKGQANYLATSPGLLPRRTTLLFRARLEMWVTTCPLAMTKRREPLNLLRMSCPSGMFRVIFLLMLPNGGMSAFVSISTRKISLLRMKLARVPFSTSGVGVPTLALTVL